MQFYVLRGCWKEYGYDPDDLAIVGCGQTKRDALSVMRDALAKSVDERGGLQTQQIPSVAEIEKDTWGHYEDGMFVKISTEKASVYGDGDATYFKIFELNEAPCT